MRRRYDFGFRELKSIPCDRFKKLLHFRGMCRQTSGSFNDQPGCGGFEQDGENHLPGSLPVPESIRDPGESQAV